MTPPRDAALEAGGGGVAADAAVEADGRGAMRATVATCDDGGVLVEAEGEAEAEVGIAVGGGSAVALVCAIDAIGAVGAFDAVDTVDEGGETPRSGLGGAPILHAAMPTAAIVPATSHVRDRDRDRSSFVPASLAAAASPVAPLASSSAARSSSALAKRSEGSFSRHRATRTSSARETFGAIVESGRGRSRLVAITTSMLVSPTNGRRPASIS